VWPVRLSVAVADKLALAPDATVPGDADAVTVRTCATGCTVSVVEPLAVRGLGPLQVAVTVKTTASSLSVRFAGAW
jgi:hypothetical protein